MDLSGHAAFRTAGDPLAEGHPAQMRHGRQLLSTAFALLASPQTESLVLHLRCGLRIERVRDLRLDGAIAHVATGPGPFTHLFPLEELVMVQRIPRGGAA